MATRAEQLNEVEAEISRLKTAIASAQGGASSFMVDGIQHTSWRLSDLRDDLTKAEKRRQRLLRGGRGIVIDMSAGVPGDSSDPYRSGAEVLL